MARTYAILSARFLVPAAVIILSWGALGAAGGPPSVSTRLSFQSGVGGYDGTVDIELWALAPTTVLDSNPNATTDANNDGGESQVLLRFEGIVGDSKGQIPPGSAVRSATLVVGAFDQGDTVHLHRMLVPWPRQATWTTLVGGVTADGLEASRHRESFTFGKIAANTSAIPFDVTDSVQAWVNGAPNHGWVFINTGGNGWDFYTHEFEDVGQRPKLIVEFNPPKPWPRRPPAGPAPSTGQPIRK